MKRKDFASCLEKNELIETGLPDPAMAQELLALAEHKEHFWQEVLDKAVKYPSLFIEGHYEIIKELCTAIMVLDGWKALNHECLFAYFKNKKADLELDFDYLLEFKDVRNDIDYRGVMVSAEIWKNNQFKVNLIIKGLKQQYSTHLMMSNRGGICCVQETPDGCNLECQNHLNVNVFIKSCHSLLTGGS